MPHAPSVYGRLRASRLHLRLPVDLTIAVIFLLFFAIAIHAFQYRGALAEDDLYRVLIGLLDGEVSGTEIASSLHYDNTFGFGYLAAFYVVADPAVLRDPDKLTHLINQVGYFASVIGLLGFWCTVLIVHGARAATLALVIFALCPTIPELATSGHSVLVMFALLFAGSTLLLLPLSGWRAVLAATVGAALLLAGLTVRVDIFLAFPWLVLTRADTRTMRGFITSCIVRSIPPMAAIAAFIVLQHLIVSNQVGSGLGEYFGKWFLISHIAVGVLYMAFGGGLATVAAGVAAALWLAWRARPGDDGFSQTRMAQFLSPAALALVPMAFFLPTPGPTRHFILTYAGFSILIAVALTAVLALPRAAALAVALLLGVASQVLAEVLRLPVLAANEAHSPYRPIWTGYGTATHLPLGWEWKRHDTLAHRRILWQAEGEMLAKPCQPYTAILSDQTAQLSSRLYANGVPVEAHRQGADDVVAQIGVRQNKTIVHLSKSVMWPDDPVARILADPTYKDYKLYQDPYTMSVYDRTAIPPERQAQFGCLPAP